MRDDPLDAQARAERVRAYRLALGEFVDVFAKAEIFLFFVLCRYSKIPMEAARALFTDVRFSVSRDRLRRLFEIGEISADKWADLKSALDHLSSINDKRNDILHYGTYGIDGDKAKVTNAILAHIEGKIRSFPISSNLLAAMTYDVRKILIQLHDRHMGVLRRQKGDFEKIEEILHATWRYTPPQPPHNPAHPGKRPARQRRP